MKAELKSELQSYIEDCSQNKMPMICKKIKNKDGLEYVTNEVIDILKQNPSFTIENAIGHVEMQLNELNLY